MASAEANVSELLSNAIKSTQELRASVSFVFQKLADGMKDARTEEAKEKVFLSEIQHSLLAVMRDFGELEKSANNLTPSATTSSLGNSGLLNLDPVTDKTPLYPQILGAYKWSNKVHDYATFSHSLLSQHSLKRSLTSSMMAKRPRKPLGTNHNVPPQSVDNMLQKAEGSYPAMTISLTRPMGSPAVLQITLAHTLRSVIILRGLIIEWVLVKGYDEQFTNENGKLDIWTRSKHAVFQKVTDHTTAATVHYYSPFFPEIAVTSFLKWLHSYSNLFSAPCHKCGKYLQDNVPPTWRHMVNLEPYHEGCKP